MNKETFINIIRQLREWRYSVEEFSELLHIEEPYELPIIPFDKMVDIICSIANFDDSIKDILYTLIWEGEVLIDEEDIWDLFINVR